MLRTTEPSRLPGAMQADGPRTFWAAVRWSYAQASGFAAAYPLIFLIPAAVEMLQHAAEIHIGFYDSPEQMQATSESFARMSVAHLKVLALYSFSYFVPRFIGMRADHAAVYRRDPEAIRLFSIVVLWNVFWAIIELDGPPTLRALGLLSQSVTYGMLFLQLALALFGLGLSAWAVAAALGNPKIGFLRSLAITSGSWIWAFGLMITVLLPPMVLHYLCAGLVLGRPHWVVWLAMTADAPLSAYLGALFATIAYAIALRVMTRNRLPMLSISMDSSA